MKEWIDLRKTIHDYYSNIILIYAIVAYPHLDFPYENLLSRENKYRHCEMDDDCNKGGERIVPRLRCQNLACLGKICVDDPINGCVSGFDCLEEYNCVHPRCGSQLQTGFGICIPLAPMYW